LKKEISAALSVIFMDELNARKRVLRRLGFIEQGDVVQLKARVACEISTGDELVLSELLFDRHFNELTPEQCAACLSCFIFEEKSKEAPSLREDLATPFRKIQEKARHIVKISQDAKMPLNEDEYTQSFKCELMEVVYQWCKGASFADIW
jgi:ATP-dependent RNA helicase DOB1